VVLFVLDFPLDTVNTIRSEGFTARIMKRAAHACIVCSIDEFISKPSHYWAAGLSRLVLMQRVLSTHRKPIEANEVPLQHLLYRTGYLHSYLVDGGLELVALSKPRKAGGFGHDLHAVVHNPTISIGQALHIGIEVYMGAIGYHAESIPGYVNRFSLSGMIIVSKDDPFITLQRFERSFLKPIIRASLTQIGSSEYVGLHHLSFEKVVTDLTRMGEELGVLIPKLQTYMDK
jgi:hypothetical protein